MRPFTSFRGNFGKPGKRSFRNLESIGTRKNSNLGTWERVKGGYEFIWE